METSPKQLKEGQDSDLKFRLHRKNLLLVAVGLLAVLVGFALMMGPSSGTGVFEPDIFSTRRIVVAPLIVFFGYLFIVAALFFPFHKKSNNDA
ncbi:MAG: DUF3098 domain-containing protein [Paludibacteraceae bacterium]|nr:DUF3098 domain-containing protein [Paludibacteraceae bacterium]